MYVYCVFHPHLSFSNVKEAEQCIISKHITQSTMAFLCSRYLMIDQAVLLSIYQSGTWYGSRSEVRHTTAFLPISISMPIHQSKVSSASLAINGTLQTLPRWLGPSLSSDLARDLVHVDREVRYVARLAVEDGIVVGIGSEFVALLESSEACELETLLLDDAL